MPKKTFYNLNKTKQVLITDAAREEFSRVPLTEASIARIIKKAEIPRGSFYQYFEDKNDLFIEIAKQEAKKKFKLFYELFEENEGDLLTTVDIFVKMELKSLEIEENKSLHKNIFLSLDEKIRNRMRPHPKGHPCREEFIQSIESKSRINLGLTEEEFGHLCKMLSGIMFRLFAHYLNGIAEADECLNIFEFELDIVKRGVESKREERGEIKINV